MAVKDGRSKLSLGGKSAITFLSLREPDCMNSHLASNYGPNLNLLAFVHSFGKGHMSDLVNLKGKG